MEGVTFRFRGEINRIEPIARARASSRRLGQRLHGVSVQLGGPPLGIPAGAVQVEPPVERARELREGVAQGQLRRILGKIGADVHPQDLEVDKVAHLHLHVQGGTGLGLGF